jgi:hypothetical protein
VTIRTRAWRSLASSTAKRRASREQADPSTPTTISGEPDDVEGRGAAGFSLAAMLDAIAREAYAA